MVVRLTKNCLLGRSGQLVNIPVGRAYDLIKAGLAYEHIAELDRQTKVVNPEIKEEPKKRGRPRKCDTQ
jgi:hypothetical protein